MLQKLQSGPRMPSCILPSCIRGPLAILHRPRRPMITGGRLAHTVFQPSRLHPGPEEAGRTTWLPWTPIICCSPRVTLSAAPACLSRTPETSLSSHSWGMPFLSLCTGVKRCPSPGPAAAPPRNQGALALPPCCLKAQHPLLVTPTMALRD